MSDKPSNNPPASPGEGALSVVVPDSDIAAVEKSRLALYEMFKDADIAMVVRLTNITQALWHLAHRRYAHPAPQPGQSEARTATDAIPDWYSRVPERERWSANLDGGISQDRDGPWVIRSVVDAALRAALGTPTATERDSSKPTPSSGAAPQPALAEALELARQMLGECSGDYNHPSFTDRHGTGPRIKEVLVKINAALSAQQQKEPNRG